MTEAGTGDAAGATAREVEALEWLVANRWSEEVIDDVRGSALGRRRLFPSDRRMLEGLAPARPANQLAFQAVDVVLQVAEGAVGVARRLAGELLGVAVAGRRDEAAETDGVSAFPVRLRVRTGESFATRSFVVENATTRTLHTVAFKLTFLTAGPGRNIPASDVTFEPAMFELQPNGSRRVTVRIRTTDAPPGGYIGLAEAGRFRQVIALEVA